MTGARRPKLSGMEAKAIALDLYEDNKVVSVVQRLATDGGYPVLVVKTRGGHYFSIATLEEYAEVKTYLATLP